jgi:hypothetical protein
MKEEKLFQTISVRLTKDEITDLGILCNVLGISKSGFFRKAIIEFSSKYDQKVRLYKSYKLKSNKGKVQL